MKSKYVIAMMALMALVTSGCKSDRAPVVEDVNNIVIEGKAYSAREYIAAFCQTQNSPMDENCIKVEKKRISDQTVIVPLTLN